MLIRLRLRRQIVRLEAAGLVRAVAEGLLGRMPAATQRDHRFVAVKRKRIACVVRNDYGAFDDQRTMDTAADGDLGHVGLVVACEKVDVC